MANSKDCSFLPPRILTFGRFLVLILGLLALTANSMADIVIERFNGSDEPNYTNPSNSTNVAEVQNHSGYSNGDVIKISGTTADAAATHTTDLVLKSGGTYNINTFTVQSATAGVKQTIQAGSNRVFGINDSSRDVSITLKDLDYVGNQNFLYSNAVNSVSLNIDNVSFKNFTLNSGGVINLSNSGDLSITTSGTVNFDNNTSNNTSSTSSIGGGAIYGVNNINFDNCNIINFNSNKTVRKDGGAIYSPTVVMTNCNEINFSNNSSAAQGGAIYANTKLEIDCDKISFNNNTSSTYGGAIRFAKMDTSVILKITGNSVTFDQNKATNNNGGAIHTNTSIELTGKSENSVFLFSYNSAKLNGGVIMAAGAVDFSTGSFTFNNNSSNNGGAIYSQKGITFSGDNTSATFTNNTATTNGNDIFLASADSILTFKNSGKYSFNGGIYLDENTAQTVINQAQVTIAGRENDNTNIYQLQNVYISNGGKLTANLDYIDSLTGTFNVSGATEETKGTLNLNVSENVVKKLNADSFKVVRTDLGEVVKTGDGTLQLCNEAQDLIDINGLVVSSGRMDILGYMTGGITVEPNSVFSPGNSVGDARFGGGYELKEGATLLIEQDASGIDTLTASSFNIDSNSIIDIVADSLQPGAEYPIIVNSTGAFSGDLQNDNFWNGLLTSGSDYYWNLSVRGDTVYASVDANAVPEPSTWALLVLGVVGLLLRKRVRSEE